MKFVAFSFLLLPFISCGLIDFSLKGLKDFDSYRELVRYYDELVDDIMEDVRDLYKEIFDDNVRFIDESEDLGLGFRLGINAYTYMSTDEFVEKRCGVSLPERYFGMYVQAPEPEFLHKVNEFTFDDLPDEIDWRDYVQPVMNQRSCGSCWAFSTMAMLGGNEGKNFLNLLKFSFAESHNRLRDSESAEDWDFQLSPQFLVDCDDTNHGCNGGWPEDALGKKIISKKCPS